MVMRAFAVAAAVLIGAGTAAFAADHSTKNTRPRSPTDLCCVNITLLPPLETSGAAESQALVDQSQITPVTDVKPGLDGANWSCRRPDGSWHCFSSLRDQ
jgi:hypothetical protein